MKDHGSKIVTHATPGFLGLSHAAQAVCLEAFHRQTASKDDWMYSVPAKEIPGGLPGHSLFVFFEQNETGGFTALLGSEH